MAKKRASMGEQLRETTHQEEESLEERFRRAEGILGERRQQATGDDLRRVKRTTFSLPHEALDTIQELRDVADTAGMRTPTQAQILRAAIAELESITATEGAGGLKSRLEALEELPPGRPKKDTYGK